MIVKIVKIYLTLSLVLWAVWGQFQGGSLCISYSVCWSRQCLISILTQRGWWWTLFFFLGSLVQSCCGEGGVLQTNNPRVQVVSQPHWACPCSRCTNHSDSTLLHREPSEAGPRLHAPPQSKPFRFGAQVAFRGTDSFGTAFCALPRSE